MDDDAQRQENTIAYKYAVLR
eukprot:COSAG01_NODE_29540_length_635_cov_0.917910_1_plen_20_part_10